MTASSADPASLTFSSEHGLAEGSGDLRTRENAVFDDGTLQITRTAIPRGLAVSGEIDESTYLPWMLTLEELAYGRDEIHIDLAGVEFCDIAGLRAIVSLTRRPDRRVVLHQVPPQLKAALRIVGWDTTPGLVLHE